MAKRHAGIVGLGTYLPSRILTNFDLEKMVSTSNQWILERTGIAERRIVDKETTSDLAAKAGLRALNDAKVKNKVRKKDVDLVIVATASPDMIFPSTACLAQEKLGLKNVPAFDILAACSGFSYGLVIAESLISSGIYRTILLIGAEAISRFVDWQDRSTCILFGDGAGAVVMQETEEGYGVLSSYLAADGGGKDLLKIPAGGAFKPASFDTVERRLHYIKMNGREVFKFAVQSIFDASVKALELAGLKVSDIDFFIPHQANKRIIDSVAKKLKIDSKKIICNIYNYGNTSTASIPLALEEIYRSGKLQRGDFILTVSFGGGLVWGANVIRWSY